MEICKLSDIAKFTTGKLNSNAAEPGGYYPFFTCAPEPLRISTYAFDTQAVILAGNNAEGDFHIQYFEGKFNAYQRTYVIEVIDKSSVDIRYLFYALRICLQRFKQISQGTATRFLTAKILNAFVLPIPPYQEQKKIAAILSILDEKIATNRAINDNLQQQVSVLYQSWFENFELSNGICPENWSYQELSTIANIASGKRPPLKSEVCNQETPIPIVGAASIMGFTSESNHRDKILVTGRVGTHGVVQRFNTPCWTSDNTLVITSPFYEFTNQILCRIDYSSMNRGSTQPLITQGDMKKVIVLIPDEETLAKFEEFAGSLMARWEKNCDENIKLALLRDTLLPKLMSGELDVSAVEF